jgi:hypothetical protein
MGQVITTFLMGPELWEISVWSYHLTYYATARKGDRRFQGPIHDSPCVAILHLCLLLNGYQNE